MSPEVELTQDDRIIGEKENLASGLSGDFSVELAAGSYEIKCPGADTPSSPFTVTAASGAASSRAPNALLDQATSAYASGVRGEVEAW